jgi:hypothetical protein
MRSVVGGFLGLIQDLVGKARQDKAKQSNVD